MKTLYLVMLSLVLANVAMADVWVEWVEYEDDQVALVWTVFPDGNGPGAAEARRPDGTYWDRPFRLRPWFRVWGGPPEAVTIEGLPAEDIWFLTADGGLAQCNGGTNPDGPSDADGWITWSQPLHAGGGSPVAVATELFVAAAAAPEPIPVAFRSPDVSGDLAVNLTDITLFTQILYGGGDLWRGDYNLDEMVNLSDIVVFTMAIGGVCP